MSNNGWIGVDLDGTLAKYDGWVSPTHIGEPIKPMVDRVKQWLAEGKEVRIFTARVFFPDDDPRRAQEVEQTEAAINKFCMDNFGQELDVTCTKDYGMTELWDDRAVQVIPNTGITIQDYVNAVNKA